MGNHRSKRSTLWSVVLSALCIVMCARGQSRDTLTFVQWELNSISNEDRTGAIRAVLTRLQPDALVLTGITNLADTAVAFAWFRDAEGFNSVDFAWFIGARMLVLTRQRQLDIQRVGLLASAGRLQVSVKMRSAAGYCYPLVVANWHKVESGASDSSHRKSATDLLTLAGVLEDGEVGCRERIFVMGTFYSGSSSDSGLQLLRDQRFLKEPLIDLADVEGVWDSTEEYTQLHTTSTTKGIQSRDAMILVSASVVDYVASWSVFGNDGAHFSVPLSVGAHRSLSPEMVGYLQSASETLPVVLQLEEPVESSVARGEEFPVRLYLR